jgi:peptide/nickel transport system substrate-binding protein
MRNRLGVRLARFIALTALIAAGLVPAGIARAADPLILNVGTTQDLGTLNPWQSITYADYEVFQVQYELLVSFGPNLEEVPGFADTWTSSADKKTHTFHIRDGMKWSDGKPATCDDALYTFQLVLDAVETLGYLGSGYLDPYLTNTGLETVKCEGSNFIATTKFPTTLLTQAYIPILPKHVWSTHTIDQINDPEQEGYFDNAPPVVGSGPYVAIEAKSGEFIRLKRNENYWGTAGVPDEIIYHQFADEATMVQALKTGELDYARGVGADLYDALATEPNVGRSEGYANGYSYLSFNTRAKQPGYKGSTSALEDVKFRDALMTAINRPELVDKVLNGHGVPGTTHVPPYHVKWHVEPTTPRVFDIAAANAKLDAAGYQKNADGKRLDKEGKPISIRLTWSDDNYPKDAQFIQGWWEQLGIDVDAFSTDEDTLIDLLYGPESGDEFDANWDAYIWSWGGDPDPMSLISLFTTDQIAAGLNDCFFSNARYDELFTLQQQATDEATRKGYIGEMQQIFYAEGCNTPLYYDSELHAYRTDKFTGWTNQPPDNGTPLFGFGYPGYLKLTDAKAVPTPGPTTVAPTTAPGATTGPTPTTPPTTDNTGANTPLIIGGVVVLLLVVAGGFLMMRRRGPKAEEE